MKRLSKSAYKEVRTWIYRNARPLELALWQFCFEGGTREHVMEMLGFYQNEDGGFGNAVEPDCWNTESSPYAVLVVTGMLRRIGFTDSNHPILRGMLQYLDSGAHVSEDGWNFSIPSNDAYPRAPWMTYDESVNRVQDMGISAGLCTFILRHGDRQSGLYAKAINLSGRILDKMKRTEDFGEMGAGGIGMLVQELEACGLGQRFDCGSVKAMLPGLVNRSIERNPDHWASYTPRPSEFIWSPDCPFYPGNEEIVDLELDYLVDTRNPGGVWNITWTWFGLGEQYPKEFAISENWWKALKAIEKLSFLEAFGRMDR